MQTFEIEKKNTKWAKIFLVKIKSVSKLSNCQIYIIRMIIIFLLIISNRIKVIKDNFLYFYMEGHMKKTGISNSVRKNTLLFKNNYNFVFICILVILIWWRALHMIHNQNVSLQNNFNECMGARKLHLHLYYLHPAVVQLIWTNCLLREREVR